MDPKDLEEKPEGTIEEMQPETVVEPTGETTPIEPETTPAAVAFSKSKARLSKLYPDRTHETDDDYDNTMDEFMGRREESDNVLMGIFSNNPEIVDILKDLGEGVSLRASIAGKYSPEELTPMEGDDDYENWGKKNSEREQSKAENEKREAEIEANLEKSAQAIKEFGDEKGLDEAGVSEFISSIEKIFDDYNLGLLTKEGLSLLYNGKNFESEMNSNKEKYLSEGRNEQIVSKKIGKPMNDGIPSISAGGGEITKTVTKTPEQNGDDYINRLIKR